MFLSPVRMPRHSPIGAEVSGKDMDRAFSVGHGSGLRTIAQPASATWCVTLEAVRRPRKMLSFGGGPTHTRWFVDSIVFPLTGSR
ncbi:hypothetical protein ASU32_17245 [Tsukamurella tyrosinosolvens]|nr:hypothetical protein ASU32_17245 [Tsukamurella tyrosinosolvens]RDB45541.1 hypothetical protein DVB87_22865 [Tsukamurella tyrosinosolvens]